MERISLQFRDRPVQSVYQRGQSKFVQLSFEPGQGLTKHRAPLALAVVVLTGKIRFTVGDDVEILDASEMLTVDPSVEHAVEAIEKSTVLLVLTPDEVKSGDVTPKAKERLQHENAYQHPELMEQIAPELRPLVEDHLEVCKVLESVQDTTDLAQIEPALMVIAEELNSHFVIEEEALFPRMAQHVGGTDVGPVARLLEEHQHIRSLHAQALEILAVCKAQPDEHATALLSNKMQELSITLLNHLGKEDSHLFPMASRLLTSLEKQAVADALKR